MNWMVSSETTLMKIKWKWPCILKCSSNMRTSMGILRILEPVQRFFCFCFCCFLFGLAAFIACHIDRLWDEVCCWSRAQGGLTKFMVQWMSFSNFSVTFIKACIEIILKPFQSPRYLKTISTCSLQFYASYTLSAYHSGRYIAGTQSSVWNDFFFLSFAMKGSRSEWLRAYFWSQTAWAPALALINDLRKVTWICLSFLTYKIGIVIITMSQGFCVY